MKNVDEKTETKDENPPVHISEVIFDVLADILLRSDK